MDQPTRFSVSVETSNEQQLASVAGARAIIGAMYDDDDANNQNFEDKLREIAEEVGRSVEHMAGQVDLDEIANAMGVDPDRAREWVDDAGSWLQSQVGRLGDEAAFRFSQPARTPATPDPLRGAAGHPLDLPTEEQGLALAALDSGRWTVEAGSRALHGHGEGPDPSDALGLVRELHARDWIRADGEVTLAGRHALSRWLEVGAER